MTILAACAQPGTTPSDDAGTLDSTTGVTADANKTPDTGKTVETSSEGTVSIQPADGAATSETPATDAVSDEDVKKLLADQDKLNALVAKGDVKGCAELDMIQFRNTCESNILANTAKSGTDTAVCAKASSGEVKTQCETLVAARKS